MGSETALYKDSAYELIEWGPPWYSRAYEVARQRAAAIGGKLATIETDQENTFLYTFYKRLYIENPSRFNRYGELIALGIGYSDEANEGDWKWSDSSNSGYSKWYPGNFDGAPTSDYAEIVIDNKSERASESYWNDGGGTYLGIAEVPLTLSINRSTSVKEGSDAVTSSINLSAGSSTSGNLANGQTIYWKVTGITADDLTSGSLSGSGLISNGKLDITHALKVDSDSGESFNLSVFSDSSYTQQIGSTSSASIEEALLPSSITVNGNNNGIANTGTINNNGTINSGTINTNSGNTTNTTTNTTKESLDKGV
jgi:hypothetical protein